MTNRLARAAVRMASRRLTMRNPSRYRASRPGAAPFVDIGAPVEPVTVIGIVGVGASPSCGIDTTLDLHRSFEVIGSDGTVMVWPESSPPRMRVHMRKAQGSYKAGWQDITLAPQPRFVGDFLELARAINTGQPLKLSYDHELLLHETLLRASGELA